MKANELMVGDWVQNPLGWKARVMSIKHTCVIKDEWEYLFKIGISKDTFQNNLSESDLSPIHLTPEILEKNGFEKQWQGFYEYFNDDENLNITFYPKSSNYTNGAYDYIDIEKGCLTIDEMPIAFVHELQHALRLCETEKEIEL